MLWIAFTMGLLGSLHCAGMCGPFALIFSASSNKEEGTIYLSRGIQYNLGRVISYAFLGIVFGMISNLIYLTGLQQFFTLLTGLLLVGVFIFSLNFDRMFNSTAWGKTFRRNLQNILGKVLHKKEEYPPIVFGVLNGFLPCGMVYLAVAGAITQAFILDSVLFMVFFGLGTFPMMMLFSSGIHFMSPKLRSKFQRIIPIVSLIFGIFLIYRGVSTELPEQLNFSFLINNPIMCH